MIVFIGKDKPDGLETRSANRDRHLAAMKELNDRGMIHFAGPFVDDSGNMCGSLIIFDTDDIRAVEDIMARDPYVLAGLFQDSEISRVKKVL